MTSQTEELTEEPERVAPSIRSGRPSRDASEQLGERILEVATEHLLAHGYGATSIEAIAREARVSKRTFYHRFADKPALMAAVVARLIDSLRPAPQDLSIEGEGLDETLNHLGSLILSAALTGRVLQLHRLIVAESGRFPELSGAIAQAGGRAEAIGLISRFLSCHPTDPPITPAQARFASEQFLQMIVSVPQSRALGMGSAMALPEQRKWVRDTVTLFLKGFTHLGQAPD